MNRNFTPSFNNRLGDRQNDHSIRQDQLHRDHDADALNDLFPQAPGQDPFPQPPGVDPLPEPNPFPLPNAPSARPSLPNNPLFPSESTPFENRSRHFQPHRN
jgi:hypothetical protein